MSGVAGSRRKHQGCCLPAGHRKLSAGFREEKRKRISPHPPVSILYVDDDEDNRHAFGWLFRSAGFEVKEAATGSEALRLAAEKPDLVILDVNLPDINGFEV